MKKWVAPTIVLAAVFVASRLPAMAVQVHDTDINLYARYAAEYRAAKLAGESFHEVHRRRVEDEIASSPPAQAAMLAEYRTVEYPPLAISFMAVPAWITTDPFDSEFPTDLQPRYARAYVWLMATVDVAVLLLVLILVGRFYPEETPWQRTLRCLVYVLCTWPLYGVLYTRLDLGVSLLVMASLALLVTRVHWSLSFAVLTLAIHFKLVPIVLAPLWVIASLPIAALGRRWREWVQPVCMRLGVLAFMGLAILTPYYLRDGSAGLEFLGYHANRGIEIESTWATLMLPMRYLGGEWQVYHSHGSFNVRTAISPLLVSAAMPILLVLVAAVTNVFIVGIRQRAAGIEPGRVTIAQVFPRTIAGFACVTLLLSIVANKVFSPQYLLWVLPLIPLIDLPPRLRPWFYLTTLTMCVLTMRIFPDFFFGEIVWAAGAANALDGPSFLGAFLLITRNILCVGLTALVAWKVLEGVWSGHGVERSPALRFGSRLNVESHKQPIPV